MTDYLNKQKKRYEDAATFASAEINNIDRNYSNNLYLVASITGTIAAAILGVGLNNVGHFPNSAKVVLTIALGILTLSLAFGVLSHFLDRNYVSRWLDGNNEIARSIAFGEIVDDKSINKEVAKLQKISLHSPRWPVILQTISVLIGVVLILVTVLLLIW